jgi:uncharacterized membrane protein
MPEADEVGKPEVAVREPTAGESSKRMDLLPKSRLEAFSDGVFAIAITLLVLEIEVPMGTESLWQALAEEWPSFLGYLVSFAFIGGLWMTHVSVTRLVKRGDSTFYGLNLLVLLFVAILPFSTKLMATHLGDKWEQGAVLLFGANLVLASAIINATIGYAMREEDLRDDTVAEQELRSFFRSRLWTTLILVVAAALAIVAPLVAVFIYLGVSLAYLVAPIVSAARTRRRPKARA